MTASKTHPQEALNVTAAETAAPNVTATKTAVPRPGVVMIVLLLIFFLGTSDNQMISPLLPRIAEDFGYGTNVGEVGRLLYPAYALAAAAAALLIGPLSDKYGRRRFLLYAAVVFGLSLLAAALIHNLYLLAAVRMIDRKSVV